MAGIGGKTIAEARQTISYAEFINWWAYIKKHGVISPQRRQEELVAWQMFHLNSINGGKAELKTFLRYSQAVEADVEASAEDVFAVLKSVAKPDKNKPVPDGATG